MAFPWNRRGLIERSTCLAYHEQHSWLFGNSMSLTYLKGPQHTDESSQIVKRIWMKTDDMASVGSLATKDRR